MATQPTSPTGGPITPTLDVLEPRSNSRSDASSVFGVRLILPHLVEKVAALGSIGREVWSRGMWMWDVLCGVFGGVLV
jgi:protein KTI12